MEERVQELHMAIEGLRGEMSAAGRDNAAASEREHAKETRELHNENAVLRAAAQDLMARIDD